MTVLSGNSLAVLNGVMRAIPVIGSVVVGVRVPGQLPDGRDRRRSTRCTW